MLAAELKRSVATAECCCAYNMLKLTRHLYCWTGDPALLRLLRARAAQPPHRHHPAEDRAHAVLPVADAGRWKTFSTEDQSFWCCTGTGVEEYAKLNDSIYWRDGDGVYVNLFIPSELDWAEKGFRLRQETKFPGSRRTPR